MNDVIPHLPAPTLDEPVMASGYQGGKDFYIDRSQVTGLADLTGKVSGNVSDLRGYVHQYTDLSGGEGWFNDISGAHASIVDTTTGWLGQLSDVTAGTASGVRDAIVTYRDTDDANAAAVDATVPPRMVSLGPAALVDSEIITDIMGANSLHSPFEEVMESRLPAPDSHDNDPALAYKPQYTNIAGFGSAMREGVIDATAFLTTIGLMDKPFDPYEWAVKPVTGDWAGLARCADVFAKVGENVSGQAFNLDRSRRMLQPVWRGRGADACVEHLGTVVSPMKTSQQMFWDLSDHYSSAAQAAAEFRETVSGVINTLVDTAAVLLLTVKAGKTPVSLLAASGAVAVEAAIIISCVDKVFTAYNEANDIITLAAAAMGDFGALQATNLTLPQLPDVDSASSPMSDLPS